MRQLNEAAATAGKAMISGGGPTVTLGGYLTGGGHGLLGPRYGMAADQVLEFEVVTPKGEIVTANECQNQDLFWALRGVSILHAPAHAFFVRNTSADQNNLRKREAAGLSESSPRSLPRRSHRQRSLPSHLSWDLFRRIGQASKRAPT